MLTAELLAHDNQCTVSVVALPWFMLLFTHRILNVASPCKICLGETGTISIKWAFCPLPLPYLRATAPGNHLITSELETFLLFPCLMQLHCPGETSCKEETVWALLHAARGVRHVCRSPPTAAVASSSRQINCRCGHTCCTSGL